MTGDSTLYPVSDHSDQGVARSLRDAPPSHYSLKIESFSKFADSGIEKYDSAVFDVGSYTWRLVIYPEGNTNRGGQGHISLYLVMDKTDWLPPDWEVHVTYKIFVYDHHKDKYLTIQDDPVHEVRFHRLKKDSGFDRLISLDIFNDATNGYLIDDSCIFGVEIYPVKYTGRGETLNMNVVEPKEFTFDWKIRKFSKISRKNPYGVMVHSEPFAVGKHKWGLVLYPNGDRDKEYLSLYLELVESPASVKKVLADYSLMVMNPKSKRYYLRSGGKTSWFSTGIKFTSDASLSRDRGGFTNFMLIKDMKRELSGFMKGTILVQTTVKIKAEVTSFS